MARLLSGLVVAAVLYSSATLGHLHGGYQPMHPPMHPQGNPPGDLQETQQGRSHSPSQCFPYGHHLDESVCRYHHSHKQRFTSFQSMMRNAQREHTPYFLIHVMMRLFQHSHTCAGDVMTAYFLFFDGSFFSPDPSDAYWGHMNNILNHGHHLSMAPGDEHWLVNEIAGLVHDTDPSCLVHLINIFKNDASHAFHQLYPDFYPPTRPPSTATTTTSTTTTTTTTAAPTTTPQPTTTTTVRTTTTDAATTSQSANGLQCTLCQGLDCLLFEPLTPCGPDQHYCFVTVQDTPQGRSISRGCADDSVCSGQNGPQNVPCSEVENHLLPDATCTFCCTTSNCNKPPSIIPRAP